MLYEVVEWLDGEAFHSERAPSLHLAILIALDWFHARALHVCVYKDNASGKPILLMEYKAYEEASCQ